ncbi:pilus assembly protein CpaF [Sedimentibacter acidaminivorans]|uniref:Pilus assembly protein CpaF n=1 Tax=Sedimentibacter acidaminivorans TaxID=913099 RepID=A0ABS4GGC5_9FIRM|nr:CpaF/VirB11 family protein [Sedimentibacter acidaminivorans]MBP1926734.1 pilus assembly protein CpaF [Sedimentibacter acidaminivorans]
MEYKDIENYVYEKIINKEGTKELREIHTQNLINCSAGDVAAKNYVQTLIKNILLDMNIQQEKIKEFTEQIFANKWGLRILEKYNLKDVDEIITHGKKVLLKKQGEIIEVPEKFNDEAEVISVIRRCLEFDKTKDLNYNNAIIEAKRKDGSRINAVCEPIGKYPYLNIRKFDSFLPTTENMLKTQTISKEEVEVLSMLVKGRANILIIGEMESGKTTFINWLLQFIPLNLITGIMETKRELYPDILYPEKHWVQLEEKLPDYPMSILFRTMLRMSVDIIVVGECRGEEVNELIKSMSRGHSGSMGSAHSMDALGAIDDFADMTLESGKIMDLKALKYRIARSVDIVIKLRKLSTKKDGKRRKVCAGIYEITTEHNDMSYDSVPIFEFEIDEENPSDGGIHIRKSTISRRLRKKLNEYGVKMSEINKVFGHEYV